MRSLSHRVQSNLWSVFIILAMVFFFNKSFDIKNDAWYPRVMIIAVTVMAVLVLVQSYFERKEEERLKAIVRSDDELSTEELAIKMAKEAEEPTPYKDLIFMVGIAVITLFLWEKLSFMLASSICMMGLFLYKKQPIVKSIIITIVTIMLIQISFKNFFTIPLPSPTWWPYF